MSDILPLLVDAATNSQSSDEALKKTFTALGGLALISPWGVQAVIHLLQSDKEKRRIGKILSGVCGIIFIFEIVGFFLYYQGIEWIMKSGQTILGIAFLLNHSIFLFYCLSSVNMREDILKNMISTQAETSSAQKDELIRKLRETEEKFEAKLSALTSRLNMATTESANHYEELKNLRGVMKNVPKLPIVSIKKYNHDAASVFPTVALPANSPIGQRKLSNLTIGQIIKDLQSIPELVKKEHARVYLGNFISWTCSVLDVKQEDDRLEISLNTNVESEPFSSGGVTTSVLESDNHHLKCLKRHDIVTVEGRINEIRLSPIIWVVLDNATVEIEANNSRQKTILDMFNPKNPTKAK